MQSTAHAGAGGSQFFSPEQGSKQHITASAIVKQPGINKTGM